MSDSAGFLITKYGDFFDDVIQSPIQTCLLGYHFIPPGNMAGACPYGNIFGVLRIHGVEKNIAKEYAHMKGLKSCFGLGRILTLV